VLEVQYTLWRRAIPYGAIAEIELSTGRDLRNKRTHTVRVHLRKRGSLRLGGVREGTAELYQVLRAAWQAASSLAAQQSTAADASPADVSAYVPPSNELSQTTQFARLFPVWFVPPMVATAALVAVIAMPGTWRRLPLTGRPAPDWKALERFPQMRTGWKGTLRPLFSGDVRYHRWNLDCATEVFSHNQTDFYIGDSIPLNLTQQFARMRAFFGQGATEARAALALNPKLAWACGLLVEQQKGEAGPGACVQAGQSALEQIPASYEIRIRVMLCLEPRWGGSYQAMDWFARQAQTFVHQNPRLVVLLCARNRRSQARRSTVASISTNARVACQCHVAGGQIPGRIECN
jgi:hypothetical protein